MCQRFHWRGGACPSCNASPIVHFLASRASPLPSCISLPAVHAVANLALACRKPLPDTSAPRCARLVASLPGRPQPSASAPRPATVSPRRLGQGRISRYQSLSFQAQNRDFCAILAFGTLVFGRFEHKIEVFVRFWSIFPRF